MGIFGFKYANFIEKIDFSIFKCLQTKILIKFQFYKKNIYREKRQFPFESIAKISLKHQINYCH